MSKKNRKSFVGDKSRQRHERKIIRNTEENMEISKELMDNLSLNNPLSGRTDEEIIEMEKSIHKKNKKRYNAIEGYEKS